MIIANSAIGISQEVRAKRALDRLSLLVAPRARVTRGGSVRSVPVEEVLVGDLALLAPGEQVVADGTLSAASELRLDESILTGESEPARRRQAMRFAPGRSPSEGYGQLRVEAVGAASFAAKVTGEARSFRHPRSPLERAVNRLLYVLVVLVVGLGALLAYSLYHRHVHAARRGRDGDGGRGEHDPRGPDGAREPHVRRRRPAYVASRGARPAAQRDRVAGVGADHLPGQDGHAHRRDAAGGGGAAGPGSREQDVRSLLGAFAAGASASNLTLEAIAARVPPRPRRRRSARSPSRAADAGAPSSCRTAPSTWEHQGACPRARSRPSSEERQRQGRRVLMLARGVGLPEQPDEQPPSGLATLGAWCWRRSCARARARRSPSCENGGHRDQGPLRGPTETVAAIARDVGIEVAGCATARRSPPTRGPRDLRRGTTVVGGISPEGKQAIVEALHVRGATWRWSAMGSTTCRR